MDPLTFLQSVSGYTQKQIDQRVIKLGTIDIAYDPFVSYPDPPPLPRVKFDGEDTASVKRYPYVQGFIPAPGQRVALVPIGTTYQIIGAVENTNFQGFYADPSTDYYSTEFGDGNYLDVNEGDATLHLNGYDVPLFPNCTGVWGQCGSSESTTSSSYADMNSPSSFSFTKRSSTSNVRIDMVGTFEIASFGNTSGWLGVRIGSTDYDIAFRFINPTNTRMTTQGVRIISGIPSGAYTIQGRWKRSSGSGTLNRFTNDDFLSIAAMEVSA